MGRHRRRIGVAAAAAALVLLLAGVALADPDADRDGVPDATDNCAKIFNPDQDDADADGLGNTCDSTPGLPANESDLVLYVRDQDGNPVTGACFQLIELMGKTEVDSVEFCADDPGYVISSLDVSGGDREEIEQSALPPDCSGGLGEKLTHHFAPASWRTVSITYACGGKTFTDKLTAQGQEEPHAVPIAATTKTVRIVVSWKNRRNVIDVANVRLATRGAAAAVKLRPGKLRISKRATPTSKTVTITGATSGTLQFDVVAQKLKGSEIVKTRVVQSKR